MITTCSRLVNNWEQAVRTHLVPKLRDFSDVFSENCDITNSKIIARQKTYEYNGQATMEYLNIVSRFKY
jgi:hypothetical protein